MATTKASGEKDEHRPFLADDDEPCRHCSRTRTEVRDHAMRRWQWIASAAIALNVLLLVMATIALQIPDRVHHVAQDSVGATLYSPLEMAVRYLVQDRVESHEQMERYMRPPSPESEDAWAELVNHPRSVYFGPSESQRLGFQAVPESATIINGSFPVSLGVFHNLHCLWNIRMSYFEDYFFAHQTEEEKHERVEHLLHCVEALRSSIVCHADLTAYPLLWKDGKADTELLLDSSIDRKCVNLDSVKDVMQQYSLRG